MKFLFIGAMMLSTTVAFAFEKCNLRMVNAASYELAESQNKSILDVKFVRLSTIWTTKTSNNAGQAEVALTFYSKVFYFKVDANQIAATSDCKITSIEAIESSTIDKNVAEAEKLKVLIGNAQYMSETDSTWDVFVATNKSENTAIDEAMQKFGNTGDHLEFYNQEETVSILDSYIDENPYENSEDIEKYKLLKNELLKSYKQIRAVKVGVPDSGSLDLYILVLNKNGYLIGLKTTVAET